MKELFEQLEVVHNPQDSYLIDTCFFFDLFRHKRQKELARLMVFKRVGMTTFNAEEVLLKENLVHENIKHDIRKFLKRTNMFMLPVDVHPGDWEGEKEYVTNVDKDLLRYIADPSDAVLIAAAIDTGCSVMTRDRHHLFTTKLENFLQDYGIAVYNKIPPEN